ncbi:MAG: ABC transporter ATP-binding protein [Clostridia bacterium]|nr:ABC transporter ATP-binding protein [Clostridia bacterium]
MGLLGWFGREQAARQESEYALEIYNLVKSYDTVKAVNDISLKVARGTLFAFLGINGAGKSTTINIICSILPKDSGKVIVNGHDLDTEADAIKNDIGIVFQTSVLDRDLTVRENLDIRTSFYSMKKAEKKRSIDQIIELLHLEPILKQPVRTLSGGQLRRVDIARAMVHQPKLLILDEPTTGLDPKTRLTVWGLIDNIRTQTGMTVFLTTHYLEEADKASDVVIMDKGRIIAQGTPNELKNMYSNDSIVAYMPLNAEFEAVMASDGVKFSYDTEHGAYRIVIADTADAKATLQRYDAFITDMEIVKGNMDDVFLNVTGRDMKKMGENEEDEEAPEGGAKEDADA